MSVYVFQSDRRCRAIETLLRARACKAFGDRLFLGLVGREGEVLRRGGIGRDWVVDCVAAAAIAEDRRISVGLLRKRVKVSLGDSEIGGSV